MVIHRDLLTVQLINFFICLCQQPTISATPNQAHPTAGLPTTYTINGFLVDVSLQWPMVSIIAAIAKGFHTSTITSETTKCCQARLLEYQKQGFSIILIVEGTLHVFNIHLKISHLASVD